MVIRQNPVALWRYHRQTPFDLPTPLLTLDATGRANHMSLYHTRHVWPLVLPPPLKLVLLALADAADPETHECWPGIAYL
jgi:hypothetical protein